MTTLDQYLEAHRDEHLAELMELLRIPSVSTSARHAPDVKRAAAWMRERLEAAGLDARVYETPGHPIVYGEWLGAEGAPTVLIYGHYDVQPSEPDDLWTSPPFEPVVRDGNIYARGATDDKGQMYCHVKGVEALMKTHGRLPVNVKLLIEGEEEVGSPSLEPFLQEHATMLKADAVIISDSPMRGPGQPSITWGLRGLSYFDIEVVGPAHDLHSGLYGGGVANPINALGRIIASFHDTEGRVAIDGFYENVRALSEEEREEIRKLEHDEEAFRAEVGVEASPGEAGYSVMERTSARPTLDFHGVEGGFHGEGAKTVLPSRVRAKFSCRLVPDQTPEEINAKIRRHVEANVPEGTRVTLTPHHGATPVLCDRTNPAVKAAERAQARVWGAPVVFTRGGGSIPIVSSFQSVLGLDSVLVGLGLEDDRLHSPNEKFSLENYHQGIRTAAYLLEELGRAS